MRIYAPDAPYSEAELKAIFNLFVGQLQHISKANSPQFKRYFYLLQVRARHAFHLCNPKIL
jgi:sister-chromatid-cohesion protein PDS5